MDDWLKVAKTLKCGRSIRVECCKKDRSQVISHYEKGYSTYCFRCGFKSRVSHGVRSPAEVLRHRRELAEYLENSEALELPEDAECIFNAPPHALAWFLQYGISLTIAKYYDFLWSESLHRIVIPVRHPISGQLEAIQMRSVADHIKPKYLNRKGHCSGAMFQSDDAMTHPMYRFIMPRVCCITEDILSTIKVGRVLPATSLLGTHLALPQAMRLLDEYDTFIVWLDDDAAGVKGTRQSRSLLMSLGAQVKMLKTDKDPKEYSLQQIKTMLGSV